MRILILHNRYQQAGGEDAVVSAEATLLHAHGHTVSVFDENNDGIRRGIDAAQTAIRCVWSFDAHRSIGQRIVDFRPDVVHIHNFFPRLSPSVHHACRQAGIPVVQTLHNYRLLCPAATLLRDGKICESCVGKSFPWSAVQHSCYHHSAAASAAVANMLLFHRLCGTWSRTVTRFIALSQFARDKFISAGLPADKMDVKPNFVVSDPGMSSADEGYALFVGRLAPEKGIETLLEAWQHVGPGRVLRIVGDGPLAPAVRDAALRNSSIEWLGRLDRPEVSRLMSAAAVLVFPSIWYEGFPMVIAEAFAAGLPVIGSCIGSIAEIVGDRETGLLFQSGCAAELASTVDWVFQHPLAMKAMRRNVRREFEARYSAEVNYTKLLGIYQAAGVPALAH
ncbi:MAG TPA: glycosyltransferase family 4 protein [Acidobacteriaceae bacterium]|jgi:glycosyltransferase involved in cell wall biosynthesis|nr:glycosyltransferase family 4 protein [Acidobacteriaceae bacterium]